MIPEEIKKIFSVFFKNYGLIIALMFFFIIIVSGLYFDYMTSSDVFEVDF